MAVDRFLGAAWATVHGPPDLRSLLLWTLDQGFCGVLPAPGPRAVDWRPLAQAAKDLPVKIPAVRVSGLQDAENLGEGGLASTSEAERERSLAVVGQAVELARALACPRVILEPGTIKVPGEAGPVDLGLEPSAWSEETARAQKDRARGLYEGAIELACRSLHGLCKLFPDMSFCLTLSRHVWGLGEAPALQAIFDDLARFPLSYWHDTGAGACRQALLGQDPGQTLEILPNMLSGITLGDPGEGKVYLPPGAGGVDYPLLAAYRQRSAVAFPVAVELDPGVDPGELPGIHAFLNKFGL